MTALPSIHDAIASIHEPAAQFITGRFEKSNRPIYICKIIWYNIYIIFLKNISARFANRVKNRTIGLVTGVVLTILGASMIVLNYFV